MKSNNSRCRLDNKSQRPKRGNCYCYYRHFYNVGPMSLTTRGAEIKFSNISHLFLILPTTRTKKRRKRGERFICDTKIKIVRLNILLWVLCSPRLALRLALLVSCVSVDWRGDPQVRNIKNYKLQIFIDLVSLGARFGILGDCLSDVSEHATFCPLPHHRRSDSLDLH